MGRANLWVWLPSNCQRGEHTVRVIGSRYLSRERSAHTSGRYRYRCAELALRNGDRSWHVGDGGIARGERDGRATARSCCVKLSDEARYLSAADLSRAEPNRQQVRCFDIQRVGCGLAICLCSDRSRLKRSDFARGDRKCSRRCARGHGYRCRNLCCCVVARKAHYYSTCRRHAIQGDRSRGIQATRNRSRSDAEAERSS